MKVYTKEPALLSGLAAVFLFALTSCTVNIGPSNISDVASSTTIQEAQESSQVDPESAWLALGDEVNALSQGAVAFTKNGVFGVLAAPTIRLYSFKNDSWTEIGGAEVNSLLDPMGINGLEPGSIDFEVRIQSYDITLDGSVDYIVNFRPAPWDLLGAPNQGRSFGWVLSFDNGEPENLQFWEPEEYSAGGSEHFSVQYIELIDDVLFGSWYGTCGRPCGTLIYEWVPAFQRLEGKEATELQAKQLERPACVDFRYSVELPVQLCDQGTSVDLIQSALLSAGFDLKPDGFFGPNTKLAVQYFQLDRGLRATGIVDAQTWGAMFDGQQLPGNDLNGDGLVTPEEFGD